MRSRSPTTCSQPGIGRSPTVSRAIWNGNVFSDLLPHVDDVVLRHPVAGDVDPHAVDA